MDIIRLYNDFNVQYSPEDEGHHAHTGWVQVNCPWCDDPSDHLGYNLANNYFNCFRCGWRPVYETIAKLLQVSVPEAMYIVDQYGGKSGRSGISDGSLSSTTVHRRERKLRPPYPSGTTALTPRHKAYLEKRGFNPDKLEHEWGLLGTGPVAPLAFQNATGEQITIDYKHRIVAPIYWRNQLVSFQTRDITDKQDPKYMFCPPELEAIQNLNLLYGKEMPNNRQLGICVEGITDVWRFGSIAFATFGTGVTFKQLHIIAKTFKEVVIVFDQEEEAMKQAAKLASNLLYAGVQARVEILEETDPASMNQEDADYFVKQIIKGGVR